MEQLINILHQLNHWHWLCFSACFFVIELLTFTTFFLWLGCAGIICAGFTYWFATSYNLQIILFGTLSIASLILTWKFKNKQTSYLNIDMSERGQSLIGKELIITDDMLFGGKIQVDGTLWSYKNLSTLVVGNKIKITNIDGNHLVITQA